MATSFYGLLRAAIRREEIGSQLRAAADGIHLKPWTELLTYAVVAACTDAGWTCGARGRLDAPLPVSRDEYLGIDVLAFASGDGWRSPLAAIELENSVDMTLVAYSLWKVCSVRAPLGCLLCYQRDREDVGALVSELSAQVARRLRPGGEILVIVGTRGHAETFPDGYFHPFRWSPDSEIFLSALTA